MRCPKLKDLPPPSAGKSGWPWMEESSPLPDYMPDGAPWPRISIVTPSYNQGRFIEETIRSVLLQGYPNLEYVVVDGASTDGSIEIIRKYERWLHFWTSEKDNGQGDAINKGLERVSGEVANWLNSDDVLYLGALRRVAEAYALDSTATLYNGSAVRIDSEGNYGTAYTAHELTPEKALEGKIPLPQPAIFFRRDRWIEHGRLNRHFYYAIDTDLFISCILSGHSRVLQGPPLALMRIHETAKTAQRTALKPMFLERYEIFSNLSKNPGIPERFRKYIYYGLNREALRISRITLREGSDWFEALRWFVRAFRYSPQGLSTVFRT